MQFIAVLELAISMTQSFIEHFFFELQSCSDQCCAVNVMLQHISEQMSMREGGRERSAFFLDREISQESPSASAQASQTYAFYMAVS